MEEDDLFNDEDVGFMDEVMDVLLTTESQYLSSQQVPRSNHSAIDQHANTTAIRDPSTSYNANRSTSSILANTSRALVSANAVEGTTNDVPMTNDLLQEKDRIIESLRFTIERLQFKVTQDESAKENALRELERVQSELRFKSQELESARLELNAMKAKSATTKQQHTEERFYRSEQVPAQTERPKKKPVFPSTPGFSTGGSRRPVSRAGSLSQDRQTCSPVVEAASLKRKRLEPEVKKEQPQTVPEKPMTDNQRIKFLKILLADELKAWLRETKTPIDKFEQNPSPAVITMLSDRFSRKFIPDQNARSDSSQKLELLARDLVGCMPVHDSNFNLDATIRDLMKNLGLIMIRCIADCLITVLIHAIDTLYSLALNYVQCLQYLHGEYERVPDISVLKNLLTVLNLFPILDDQDEQKLDNLQPYVPMIPKSSFVELKRFCEQYKVDASDILLMNKTRLPFETRRRVLYQITDIFLAIHYKLGTSRSLELLLENEQFASLVSASKPLKVMSKAMDVVLALANVDGSWFFSEHNVDVNYVPILDRLVEIMRMPCPSLSQDVEWYRIRIKVFVTLRAILSSGVPESWLKLVCETVLMPVLQTIKSECTRLEDMAKPPYIRVPMEKSQELIADGVLCVIDMLEMYPAIVSDTESQRYATIVDTLRKASERAEEHWKSGDQVSLVIREASKSLMKLSNKLSSSSSSDQATGSRKTQDPRT